MIIKVVSIKKFRGFANVEFSLANHVTLIAGQNGTQKSTLLGLISQPFSITDKENPISSEKPLSGGNYKSSFNEKFRLSPHFDKAQGHEWTTYLHTDEDNSGFTIESIKRDSTSIRFWKKGDRSKGAGYLEMPVIFLSLKRLVPTAEERSVKTHNDFDLTSDERAWFAETYKKVMLSNDNVSELHGIKSTNKQTLGVTTDYYDWNANSAGQDNLAKILLAVLSFKRLNEKHPSHYKGGILAIDELDATLYPGSQIALIKALSRFCSKFKIQVIATTHSLQLLEEICKLRAVKGRDKQFSTIYLKRFNQEVNIEENPKFDRILHNLNVSLDRKAKTKKVDIYTEDMETIHFTKAVIKRQFPDLKFVDCTLGCEQFIDLGKRKIPSFSYPNSIVVLDGDARNSLSRSRLRNFICLPGEDSPEAMLGRYLDQLPDDAPFWTKKNPDYCKQYCFKDFALNEILNDRIKAKQWYRDQLKTEAWGREANLVYKGLLSEYEDEVNDFISKFKKIYQVVKKENH